MLISCNGKDPKDKKEHLISDSMKKEQDTSLTSDIYTEDNLTIRLINSDSGVCIETVKGNFERIINLDKNKIAWKAFPSVIWANEQYACIMTFWTGPISYHLFLPTKDGLEIQYFTEDVERTDSINNNICYINTITDNAIFFYNSKSS